MSIIDFDELHDVTLDCIEYGDIQRYMSECHRITKRPILCVDVLYNVFGIAPSTKTGDKRWDTLLIKKKYSAEEMLDNFNEGYMQSVNKKQAPFIIDWGQYNEEYPKVQGVVKVNGVIEGYVTMLCEKGKTEDEYLRAMEVIQKGCSLMFRDIDLNRSISLSVHKTFVARLLDGQITSKRQLVIWEKDIGISPKPPYYIGAVQLNGEYERNVLTVLGRSLVLLLPNRMSYIKDQTLYIFTYDTDRFPISSENDKAFRELLIKYNARCGLSNSFEDIFRVTTYIKQAQEALRLSKLTKNYKNSLYLYKDMYLPAILDPIIQSMDRASYISPIILMLEKHDKEHNTEFLNTLKCYVNNLCASKETAQMLHIHRNTLSYRIEKIEELGGVSLHDPELFLHLMMSFYMDDNS